MAYLVERSMKGRIFRLSMSDPAKRVMKVGVDINTTRPEASKAFPIVLAAPVSPTP